MGNTLVTKGKILVTEGKTLVNWVTEGKKGGSAVGREVGRGGPKIYSPKIFPKKDIFTKNISGNKCLYQKYFQKNIFTNNNSKKKSQNIFMKKKEGVGKAPLLPAGPRLISSDSE